MNMKKHKIIVCIAIIISMFCCMNNVFAVWYNDTFEYTRGFDVDIGENVTDYQILINITDRTNAQIDCSDTRFTKEDNVTELYYWIEECNSNYAHIWVNVTSLNTDNDTQIQYWYGNVSEVISLSNGTNVFEFFDDFEDNDVSDWTKESGAILVAQSGTVYADTYASQFTFTTEGAEAYKSFTSTTDTMIFEGRFRSTDSSTGTKYIMITGTGGDHTNSVYIYFTNEGKIFYYDGSSTHELQAYSINTWYHLKITVNVTADTFDLDIDGVNRVVGGGAYGDITSGISAISMREWTSSQNWFSDNLYLYFTSF